MLHNLHCIGIVVFIMGVKYLPKTKNISEKLDIPGFVLQFLGTSLLFTSIILAQKTGFNNKYIISALIVSIILITIFICVEARNNQPLLALKIFKNRSFSISLICAFISFVCLSASAILLPFYFQYTIKLSPLAAGLLLMVCPITLGIFSPICGTLSDKIGTKILSLIGLFIISTAFLLLSSLKAFSICKIKNLKVFMPMFINFISSFKTSC